MRSWAIFVFGIAVFFVRDLKDLAVNRDAATDDPQHRENGHEDSPGSDPLVQVETEKKTKQDASSHGQADLHYNGKIFCPDPVFVISKVHVPESDSSPAAVCLKITSKGFYQI